MANLNTNFNSAGEWYVRKTWAYNGTNLNDGMDDWTIEWATPDIGKKKDRILSNSPINFSFGENTADMVNIVSLAESNLKIACLTIESEVVDKILEKKAANPALNIYVVADNTKTNDPQFLRLQNGGANITFDTLNDGSMNNSYIIVDDKKTIYSTARIPGIFKSTVIINSTEAAALFSEDFAKMKSGKFGDGKDISFYYNWLQRLKYNPVNLNGIRLSVFMSPNQNMIADGISFYISDETPAVMGYYKSFISAVTKPLKSSSLNTKEVKIWATAIEDPYFLYRLRNIGFPSYNIPVTVYLDKTAYMNSSAITKTRLAMLKNIPNRVVKLVNNPGNPLNFNLMMIKNTDGTKDLYYWTNKKMTVEESGGKESGVDKQVGINDESGLFLYGFNDLGIAPVESQLAGISPFLEDF